MAGVLFSVGPLQTLGGQFVLSLCENGVVAHVETHSFER